MYPVRVMPCLLLDNGALVKTRKFRNPSYIGDPLNTIRIFNEKQVDELIVLNISASRHQDPPPFDLIKEIASECFMPLAYGGGMHSVETIRKVLSIGIEKVVLNTCALEQPNFIRDISRVFGSQSIVISVDIKRSFWGGLQVLTRSATKRLKIDALQCVKLIENMGAGEILVHSVDRDGSMSGYDLPLIRQIASAVSIPVVACGGAESVVDLGQAIREGASAAAAGSIFVYQGKNRSVLINFPTPDELRQVLP